MPASSCLLVLFGDEPSPLNVAVALLAWISLPKLYTKFQAALVTYISTPMERWQFADILATNTAAADARS